MWYIIFWFKIGSGSYYTKQQLQSHGYNAHGINNKGETRCELCCKNFDSARNLQRHKRSVHEGRKDYNCELCGKSFATEFYLKTHTAKHKEGEEFKCDSCTMSFFKEIDLSKHQFTVHEGHKDGQCGICSNGKQFADWLDLKSHVYNVHEMAGSKDHLCTLCGKSFKHSKTLRDHILSVSFLKYLLYEHTYIYHLIIAQ